MKKIILLFFALSLFGCKSGPGGGDSPAEVKPDKPAVDDNAPLPLEMTGHLKGLSKRYGRKFWRPGHMYRMIADQAIPNVHDWRANGFKVRIHNQGSCGSCWADATTTCAMGTAMIFEGSTVELSVQQIVSCEKNYFGCGGGLFAGSYVKKYGLISEVEFPYKAANLSCPSGIATKKPSFAPHDYVYIGAPDRSPTEDEVDAAIYNFGYVGVSFGAGNAMANFHGETAFNQCRNIQTNHEVAAFGYDRTDHHLKLQNSWGTSFGRKSDPGTWLHKWGCDHLAEDAGYFVPKSAPCKPPKVHLAAESIWNQGDRVTFAVEAEASVSYEWFSGTTSIGTGAVITIDPPKLSMDVRLVAKNNCGEAEIKTLVTIKQDL